MRSLIRIIFFGLLVTSLLLGSWLPLNHLPASAAGNGEEQLELPPLEKPDKGNPKLDSHLNRKVKEAGERRSLTMMQEGTSAPAGETVRVIIECRPGQADAVRNSAAAFGNIETGYKDLIQMDVPVSALEALANNPDIRLVRTPIELLPMDTTSEGVALINADDWHTTGYDGTGVKVGIVDGGFYGYTDLLGTDLPASVTTNFNTDNTGSSYHGTGCAEIIYDIAPGAQFYLAKAGTTVEMGVAVDWLISQDVDVISCSMGSPVGGPGNGTGTSCEIVDDARAAGIFWAQAAGNSAESHWKGDWADSAGGSANGYLDFIPGSDELVAVYLYTTTPISIYLKWNDSWGSASNDYDLLLFNNTASWPPVVSSTDNQSQTGYPVEVISNYTATYEGIHYIAVGKYSASGSESFHLFTYPYPIEPTHRVAAGSLSMPADSGNATAVGAVNYSTPTTLEDYSSRGPTDDSRVKPDLVAPTGVSTNAYGETPFSGTSAAAPHVAGAAVLVKERYSSYTPAQIQSYIEDRAAEIGGDGKDNLYGSGRLDLGTPPAPIPPTISTCNATAVTANTAVLTGNLTSLGGYSSANVSFEWGTQSGSLSNETTPVLKTSTGNFSTSLGSLSSNTTYYFRAKVTANPTVYGSELSFYTSGTEIWSQTFGGSNRDVAREIRQTADGGYIVTGYTKSSGAGNTDAQLIKTNSSGNMTWSQTFGGTDDDISYSVVQTSDGGYIIAGCSNSTGAGGMDGWMVKTNSSGNMTWSQTFGGINSDILCAIKQTADGGYVATGYTNSYGAGNYDVWLIKTNSSGNMTWSQVFGGASNDNSYSVNQTTDGGYIIVGMTESYGAGDDDVWLIKTNSSGNMTWSQTFGGTNQDYAYDVIQATDGGYAIAATTRSQGAGYWDFWLIKTNSSGNMTWEQTYGGANPEISFGIRQTTDGGYILTGTTYSYGTGGGDSWLVKTDSSGNMTWSQPYGGIDDDIAFSVVQTTGEDYVFAGGTKSYGNGEDDVWLVKVPAREYTLTISANGSGTTSPAVGSHRYSSGGVVSISATPASGNKFVSWTGDVANSTSSSTTVTMNSPQSLIANFAPLTPPTVTTNNATSVTSASAVLNGNLTSLGEYSSANVSFQWGNASDNLTNETTPQSKTSTGNFSASISGLSPSSTYYFRTKAVTYPTVYGNTINFTSGAVLESINVTPVNPSLPAGRTTSFTATGTYSDASTANLSSSVTWTSSDTSVARVYSNGLVRSFAAGTTLIKATTGNCTDNTTLTVTAAVLDSVSVTPANPSVTFVSGSPPTLQFVATAVYSDGSSSVITGASGWSSSNTGVATISGTGMATTVASGSASINATYSDKMGYTTLTVLADTVAPKVTLTSPTDGQVLSSTSVNVTGSVNDVSATANITINGNTTVSLTIGGDGSFNRNISSLTANASNTLLVRATDGAGNTGTSGTVTVTVSPTKPGITITQPASGLLTDNATQTVSGTVTGNVSSVNLVLNGTSQTVAVTAGSFSQSVTLSEGTNIIAVNAYISGHTGDTAYRGTSGIVTVTLDTTAPAVDVNCPSPGSVVSTAACTVSGTIDDPDVNTANLTLNGSSQSIPVSGGNFTQSITLASGSNTITVRATDEAGNTATPESVTVTLDNTKPDVTITSPASGTVTGTAAQTVSGTVNDPSISTATLYLNGSSQAISVTAGSFSQGITLASGSNTIEVRATDGASNTGTSGNVTVTLDTTAPTVTIGLSDPTDSITVTVKTNEALSAAPTVTINPTVTMQKTGINTWTGTYGSSVSPISTGNYTVTVSATDRAGNNRTKTATFCKETVTIAENATVTVGTSTTTLQIDTSADVTDASISVTQHIDSPSGNAGNPSGAGLSAGVFLEIVASPSLRDNLEGIYIEVSYNESDLPSGTDESSLRLYLWDIATGTWQEVSGSGVNTTANYIYGTLTHLSKFGGFGTATITPPSTPPSSPPGGGGGGGGGTPAGWTMLSDFLDENGVFLVGTTAQSEDQNCGLWIPAGVQALNKYGNRFTSIVMREVDEPPAPPENSQLVGKTYELDPSGATFQPAITMTMRYDPETLPSGVGEDEMYIAYWTGDSWSAFESTVNTNYHTVSTQISHFTKFTIIGSPPKPKPKTTTTTPSSYTPPAEFEVSDLIITPGEVKTGEEVTVSVTITNTGGKSGKYTATLTVDNEEEASKEVTVGAGESKTVTFTLSRDAEGEYEVKIGDSSGSFNVVVPEVETVIHAEEEEEAPAEPEPRTNTGMIIGIIIGVLAIGGAAGYYFIRRKREPSPQSE